MQDMAIFSSSHVLKQVVGSLISYFYEPIFLISVSQTYNDSSLLDTESKVRKQDTLGTEVKNMSFQEEKSEIHEFLKCRNR